ncbi:thioredoxin family protein [Candidatus Micrarchaeota archaeon]|nr:thioredoxin family protein [Candidatus Micrarchaeota archaeon]
MVLVSSRYDILKKGEKAVNFSLQGIDGKTYSLASFAKAKALLIIFMCNHCPYVRPKFDYFVELQRRYASQGLQIVGINPNDPTNYPDDNLDGMTQTAREQEFNFPYLVDEKQKIAIKYGAICTPDPYLFNEKRELVYHGRFDDAHKLPHDNAKTSEIEDAIKQVLAGKEVTVETMPSMGCSIKWTRGNEPKYYIDALPS